MARIDILRAQREVRQQQKQDAFRSTLSQPVAEQSNPASSAMAPVDKPVLQKVDANKVYESTRNQALAATDESKAEQAQEFWNASPLEYWSQQAAKDPNNTYAYLQQMYASDETPEEKKKRERREMLGNVFQGLGTLIGSAANLYGATRSGYSMDFGSMAEKQQARMERLKSKQDALDEKRKEILMNARMSDVKTKRDAELKAEERTWKIKYDAYMKELDHAHKMGQIDAQTRNRLIEQAAKTKDEKELEAIKQQNRIVLKQTPTAGDSKVITSLTGSDGGTWTRNTKMSEEEIRELSKYVEDWTPYTSVDEDGKETIDYVGAISDASDSGNIPDYVLEERGFKRSKDSSRRKKNDGFSFATEGFSFK